MSGVKSVVATRVRGHDSKGNQSKYWYGIKYLRKSRAIFRRYNETKPWLDQLYGTFLNIRPRMTIVDVGCGTGDFTRYLASLSKGKNTIVGIDSSEKGLAAAASDTMRNRFSKMISYKVGDVYNIPVDDEYANLTCCRSLLIHLTDPLKAVKEMGRVTKIRGSVAAVERGKLSAFVDPNDETYSELSEQWENAWGEGVRKLDGKGFRIGERLPGIFHAAGLTDIKAEVQADAWLYSDPRRRLTDVKEQLRFDLSLLKARSRIDRKYLIAGGMTPTRIDAYNKQTFDKLKALLSDDRKLRNDPTLYVASRFLVSGIRTT